MGSPQYPLQEEKVVPMPSPVRISMWLLSVTYMGGLVEGFFDRQRLPRLPGDQDRLMFAMALIAVAVLVILLAAVFFFIVQSMTRGKNWARYLLAILLLLEAPYAWQIPGNFAGASTNPVMEETLWLIQCVAIALLFLPASNHWFRLMRRRFIGPAASDPPASAV
jgi:hypothetical protein